MTHVFTLEEARHLMPRVKAITKPVFATYVIPDPTASGASATRISSGWAP